MSEIRTTGTNHMQTLCWDCEKAIGGCSWADHWDHTPVNGWNAIPTKIKCHNPSCLDDKTSSFIVLECPEFCRDAVGYGARRIGEPAPRTDPVDADAIIQAYKCGIKVREIMRIEKCTSTTIYSILRKAGIRTGEYGDRKKGRKTL